MTRLLVAALALLAFLASACGSGSALSGSTVRVLGSWTGSEADSFRSVVQPFEDRTGIRVEYTATRDLRGTIASSLADGDPPDVAGLDGPGHLAELAADGSLRDLGDIIDLLDYKRYVAPTFVELGSVDSRLLGVFLKATLKGLIWFNPAVFQRGVPSSFDDLVWMSEPYMDGKTRQWCVGLSSRESSGWPGTDLVESFLIHEAGVAAYDDWVAGDLAWTSAEVRHAFESFGRVVADDAVHGGASGAVTTAFDAAGDPLFSDPPGCVFLHQASFMPGFFDAMGHRAGQDYDFMPFPSMSAADRGAAIGGGDLFGVLTNNPAADELMRYLVSPEAQEILVSGGSALSVDERVDAYPNDLVHREAAVLAGATHFRFDASDLMPATVNAAFLDGVLDYTRSPAELTAILERIDQVRVATYGD